MLLCMRQLLQKAFYQALTPCIDILWLYYSLVPRCECLGTRLGYIYSAIIPIYHCNMVFELCDNCPVYVQFTYMYV